MESMEKYKPKARATITSIAVLSAFVLTCVVSSQRITGSVEVFIPLICTADTTVGLHDAYQEDDSAETYDPRVFLSSEFKLEENRTFRDLLADEDVDLYLTLHDVKTDVAIEFSCKSVEGRGQRSGYSCVNSPPTEMLAMDPKTLRFSRASVSGWTFYTAEDLKDSAVLFVEKGTCEQASSARGQEKNDEPSD